jgi:hypothetical protein
MVCYEDETTTLPICRHAASTPRCGMFVVMRHGDAAMQHANEQTNIKWRLGSINEHESPGLNIYNQLVIYISSCSYADSHFRLLMWIYV